MMRSDNGRVRDVTTTDNEQHTPDHVHSSLEAGRRRSLSSGQADSDSGLLEMCFAFRNGVKVKDHKYHAFTYKNTFVGSEAVDFMVRTAMAASRAEAVELGRALEKNYRLFEHVAKKKEFEDEYLFYRFCFSNRAQPDRQLARSVPPQRRIDTQSLSYSEMCLDSDGSVLRKEQIRAKRIKLGYCPTCPGEPVLLFDIQRSRLNPLSRTTQPLTVEGECLDGHCLCCYPELAPKQKKKKKKRKKKPPRDNEVEIDYNVSAAEERLIDSSASLDFHASSDLNASSDVSEITRDFEPSSHLEQFLGRGSHRKLKSEGSVQSASASGRKSTRDVPPRPIRTDSGLCDSVDTGYARKQSPRKDRGLSPLRWGRTENEFHQNIHSSRADNEINRMDRGPPSPRPLGTEYGIGDSFGYVPTENYSRRVDRGLSSSRRSRTEKGIRDSVGSGYLEYEPERMDRHYSGSSPNDRSMRGINESADAVPRDYDILARRLSSSSSQQRSSGGYSVNSRSGHSDGDSRPRSIQPYESSRCLSDTGGFNDNASSDDVKSTCRRVSHPLLEAYVDSSASSGPVYADYRAESSSNQVSERPSSPIRAPIDEENATPGELPGTVEETFRSSPAENVDSTVRELETLVAGSMASGDLDLVLDILLAAMKNHAEVEPIQLFCISTFFSMCKNSNANSDAHKASMMASSAPDDILLAMKNLIDSPRVQEEGCRVLWCLALDKNNRSVLSRAGAVDRIMGAIKEHENRETAVQTAIGALRTLSPEPEVREILHAKQSNKTVAQAMAVHLSSETIQRDGIAFLSNAAVDIEKQHVALASFEELHAIVRAMAAHSTSEMVVSGACFALKNYMFEERNIMTLRKCDDVVPLLTIACNFAQKEESRRNASIVLHFLEMSQAKEESLHLSLSHMNLDRDDSDESDADVDEILRFLADGGTSLEMIAGGLQTLLNLASQSPTCRKKIVEARDVSVIVTAMKRHETCSKVQEQGCKILQCLAEDKHESRHKIIVSGGCDAIINGMQKYPDDKEVLIAAFKALKVLSVEFECWFELEKNGHVRAIQDIIGSHMDVETLQREGTEILTNFSAYSS